MLAHTEVWRTSPSNPGSRELSHYLIIDLPLLFQGREPQEEGRWAQPLWLGCRSPSRA